MTARILCIAVVAILVFLSYAFAVPALLSENSMACILSGVLLLVLPVVAAIVCFVEIYKKVNHE